MLPSPEAEGAAGAPPSPSRRCRYDGAVIVAVMLALLQASAPAPPVSHERLGEGRYRLRIELPGTADVGQAQRMLLPAARSLCGDLPPVFGHYSWQGSERLESAGAAREAVSLTLEQELACGAAEARPAEVALAPDPGWQPTPATEQAVLDTTRSYFAAKDSGRYADAYAMLSAGNQATTPIAAWSAQARSFNAGAGAVRGRRLIRVTWYNNPPSAPVPGIYAAVDFDGDFANLHFLCGYVVWLLQPEGRWRLVREEQSLVSRSEAHDATAEEIARLRPQVGCRD